MADRCTAERLAWLQATAEDRSLSHLAARVAALLALRYVNGEAHRKGEGMLAWPSQRGIAERLNCTEEAVRRAVLALEAGGYLEAKRGQGRGVNTRYRLLVKSPMQVGLIDRESPTPVGVIADEKPQPKAQKTPTDLGTNPLKEPSEESEERFSLQSDASERAGRRRPETAIPADFPDLRAKLRWRERAAGAGVNVDLAAERFRAHAETHDRRARRWPAAFDNWMLKAIEDAAKRQPVQQGQRRPSALDWALQGGAE